MARRSGAADTLSLRGGTLAGSHRHQSPREAETTTAVPLGETQGKTAETGDRLERGKPEEVQETDEEGEEGTGLVEHRVETVTLDFVKGFAEFPSYDKLDNPEQYK